MKNIILFSSLLIIAISNICFAQTPVAELDSYISQKQLVEHVNFLASDELEGRNTGEQGQKLAAVYIANEFQKYGLSPINNTGGNSGYFQKFNLNTIKYGNVSLNIDYRKYKNNWNFIYAGNSNTSKLTENQIAFIGYGNDNDLNGLDIKDKGVLLIAENIKDGIARIKELSKKHNTTTFYLITNNKSESVKLFKDYYNSKRVSIKTTEPLVDYNIKSSFIDDTTSTYRVFFINKSIFKSITNTKYKTLKKLTKKNQTSNENLLKALPTYKLEYNINFEYNTNKLETENVIGYIENNPNSDSTIIFCGHYDHIGTYNSRIYNGADDNASGTSAVLDLAKAYSSLKKDGIKSKYNYLFIAFTAEELGLFGSKYYVDNPVKPLNKNTLVVNMDMIGRVDKKHTNKPDYVYILKRKLKSREYKKAVKSTAKSSVTIDTDFTPGLYKRLIYTIGSDHQSFAKKDIPNFVFFTGLHDDYHKHTDTADKIDFDKLKKITELIFLSTYQISEAK